MPGTLAAAGEGALSPQQDERHPPIARQRWSSPSVSQERLESTKHPHTLPEDKGRMPDLISRHGGTQRGNLSGL